MSRSITTRLRVPLAALCLMGAAGVASGQTGTGGEGETGGGGCIPEPKYEKTSAGTQIDSEVKEHVWAYRSGIEPNESASGEQDSGRYRKGSASANSGGTSAGLHLYLWAEDEDEVSIWGVARTTQQHKMWTECKPKPGHVTPEFGDSVFTISSRAELVATATSPQNDGGRSADATLKADLPTGQSVRTELTFTDGSAPTNEEEVTVTLSGGATSATNVGASASATQAVQAAVSKAQKFGAGATITYKHKRTWKTNEAITAGDSISVTSSDSVRPKCHGGPVVRFESSDAVGAASLGSPWSGEHDEIDLNLRVKTITNIHKQAGATCSLKGQEPPPTGTVTPRDPQIPTTTQDGPTTGSGTDSRATTTPSPDGTTTTGSAKFQIQGPAPSTSHLRIPADSEPLIAFAGAATATRIDLEGEGEAYDFSPTSPIELPAGAWMLSVPLHPLATGVAFVELSFDPDFGGDEPARSVIELVDAPFSVDVWTAGQHLGVSQFERELTGVGVGERIWLESLWPDPVSLGEPAVAYEVVAGGEGGFWDEPRVEFDAGVGAWFLTMAPVSAATVEVSVTFAGSTVEIPVVWAEGAPVDGDEVPPPVDEDDDDSDETSEEDEAPPEDG